MVKYSNAELREFLLMVVESKLLKDKKITRPYTVTASKIKEDKKRSFKLYLNYTDLKGKTVYQTEFYVSAKFFKNAEYDFSNRWQRYLYNNENTQMV